jgi:hypothetical protein
VTAGDPAPPLASPLCRVHHRLEAAEVERVDPDLGGHHDLVLVDRHLRVVTWQCLLAERLDEAESGSVALIVPAGRSGGR